jgi:hypothetical protein
MYVWIGELASDIKKCASKLPNVLWLFNIMCICAIYWWLPCMWSVFWACRFRVLNCVESPFDTNRHGYIH